MLKLYLLGPPRIELNNEAVHISRRKAVALLAYLAVTGRPHGRDALATLFYPEINQSQARSYFRRDLSALNRNLEGDWLVADYDTVSINEAAEVWTDVSQFQQTLAGRENHAHPKSETCPLCLPLLAQAAALYGDHFLAGFSLPDAPEFEEWHFFEALNLQQELAFALDKLITGYLVREQYEEAIPYAQRLLKLDPLHEPAHRYLLMLYAMSGQQAAALRQYDQCRTLLEDELGVPPEEETTSLYEDIKARQLEQVATRIAGFQSLPTDPLLDDVAPRPGTDPLPAFILAAEQSDEEPPVFVARERELAVLDKALDSARNGQGQILFVMGGAGRGKTTLLREFSRRAGAADAELVVITGNCKAIGGIGDPYLPFREAITMLTGDAELMQVSGLINRKQARRLWDLLPITLPALVKYAPDLIDRFVTAAALHERAAMVFPQNTSFLHQIVTQTAERKSAPIDQTALFTQYVTMLKAVARQHPLLLIIEDLHWVDAASSALLFHLSKELENCRILLVGTFRPEEVTLGQGTTTGPDLPAQHPLADIVSELKRQHGDIGLDLGDMAAIEGRQFVDAYLDTLPNHFDEAFREALFRHTEGHALFTVELVRAMQEREDLFPNAEGYWIQGDHIDWTSLPAKVEGIIERRIKRLPATLRSILTTASVEGETFTAEVLAHVHQVEGRTLVQQLSGELDKRHHLITAQGIEWLFPGRQRLSVYRFKHQLFQHYLYHRLDEVERGYLHESVGNAIEELYAEQTEQVASQLAHHFEAAGLVEKAIHYLTEAGDTAATVHANIEAAAYYERAVTLAEQAGMSTDELAHLYVSLGGQLIVTKGDGAPEVGQAFERALALYGPAGTSPQRFAALRGMALYHNLRGEPENAQQMAEAMLVLANTLGDPALLVEAYYALGSHFFYLGNYVEAWAYLAQGIKNYDQQQHQSLIHLYGQDPGVANLCYACLVLWLLGYPDQALAHSTAALELAQELDHPYSLAMANIWSAWHHYYRRENAIVLELTETAIQISGKHNFTIFIGVGQLLRGWALVEQGDIEEGISVMQQGLVAANLATGADDTRTEWSAIIADTYHKAEQTERAQTVLLKALSLLEISPHPLWGQTEIYRLQGEILLHQLGQAAHAEAEACFRQAIDLAGRQDAKSLEIRAVLSLCHLWQTTGKTDAAHRMLLEIYDWFSEGFATRDLVDAQTLLSELPAG